MPHQVLMGNVPPLAVMTQGTPDQVTTWARECLEKTNGHRLILSAGGGVSPGTPAENIDALVAAVPRMRRAWCVWRISRLIVARGDLQGTEYGANNDDHS